MGDVQSEPVHDVMVVSPVAVKLTLILQLVNDFRGSEANTYVVCFHQEEFTYFSPSSSQDQD